MRASRLLSILMTLQARGQITAQALADECEVSLRTIYRDIDELSGAGIPVYSERGAAGGYRLLDGYRTRLNGLSAEEAEVLFLAGLPSAAADLGFGAAMASAQLKLLAAMPQELRAGAERMRSRFHFDAPRWFDEAEQPQYLSLVAKAVWEQRAVVMRYRSWKGEKDRRVEPLGVVLKSGVWYFIGQTENGSRTYRLSRILEMKLLDQRFQRPEDFDLASYWKESTRRAQRELHSDRATLRLSPLGLRIIRAMVPSYVREEMTVEDEADSRGWRTVTLPIAPPRQTAAELLRLGAEVEVLEPIELRRALAETAEAVSRLYRE